MATAGDRARLSVVAGIAGLPPGRRRPGCNDDSGCHVDPEGEVAACVGTKEFVATAPQFLRLRRPDRDTVLYPAVSYPTYAMGATLAGVPFRARAGAPGGGLDLSSIDPADAARALLLWVNSPCQPDGASDRPRRRGRRGGAGPGIPVLSDECYAEFTWDGPPRTILESGTDGVVAVHSLSKRSNLAGVRAGFYAGDPALVAYLRDVRRHAGLMVPGPVQAGAVVALDDDVHVEVQREPATASGWPSWPEPSMPPDCRSTPAGGSTSGPRCPQGWPTVVGDWPSGWPPTAASWSARATSTATTAPDSCGWRWSSRWTGSSWSPTRLAELGHRCGPPSHRVPPHPSVRRPAGTPGLTSSPMSDLQSQIEALWSRASELGPSDTDALAVVTEAIDLLDKGTARVAEVDDATDEVVVHEWLKQAILLLFRVSAMETLELGPFEFADKLPLKTEYAAAGVRVVPGPLPAGGRSSAPA